VEFDCDALVIGAGPAGSAAAIWLAKAGWKVMLVEQHGYPRRKVCGECVAAGNLALLDELGVGADFRGAAGPELREVGWIDAAATVTAAMPFCASGLYRYGRALGRDRLDAQLLERAKSLGAIVLQPARVRAVRGDVGNFECMVEPLGRDASEPVERAAIRSVRAPVVVDAHGSWERRPGAATGGAARPPRHGSDLFGFKAIYRNTALAPGYLPVLALPGGYGGLVVADGGRTTLACCIRRDTLSANRALMPQAAAGVAVEAFLRRSVSTLGAMLQNAERDGQWMSVGPLQPGIRVDTVTGAFRVGNAAGESHPLIGEGITMALQSSGLLADILTSRAPAAIDRPGGIAMHRAYAAAWRRMFAPRLRLAALYAQIAMRPTLARPARAVLRRWPSVLSGAARLAGKATRALNR
jgi:flavin-dependent dehydrogenase